MTTRRACISDDERAERRRADRELARKAVEQLQSSDGWRAWLAARSRFHRYSFANQLLIAMQCPQATRVAGFRAWLKLGYAVRKGERAIRIWVPMRPSKGLVERWREHGEDPLEEPRLGFRLGPVFDRSQVEALPPPATPVPLEVPIAPVEGDELAGVLAPLIALAEEIRCTVEFEPMRGGRCGYFDPGPGRIAVSDGLSGNGQVKTLVHELAHALARQDRNGDGPRLDYASEELVVESVAFTVCGSLGLDTTGYSIPYIASWSLQVGIGAIEQSAALIDRLARRIEETINDVPASRCQRVHDAPVVPVGVEDVPVTGVGLLGADLTTEGFA
ncbi:MAG: ArdC-like ssDNA-binding domain-containing protein [Solirubrobacteraceae bacterium]|jgi:antirestriction protein ArdC